MMRRSIVPLIALVICLSVGLAQVGPGQGKDKLGPLPDLHQACWIWSSKGGTEEVVFFRKKFTLPARPLEATLVITADNGFDLHVNGRYIAGEAGADREIWATVERFRLEKYLIEGANVIALRGDNLGGPGGVIAALRVRLANNQEVTLTTDDSWLMAREIRTGWTEADHDDSLWPKAIALGKMGMAPWGKLEIPKALSRLKPRTGQLTRFSEPAKDEAWPAGVVFLSGKAPLDSTPGAPQAIWPIQGSRAFLEYDTPAPAALGRKLWALAPARPDAKPRLLLDAGKGMIGPPTASFDGKEILFSMAPVGEKFFHVYRMDADGSGLKQLTFGPWHDYDPALLPDGRIAFSSTRIGSRDEYHGNTARSLFTLSADRKTIKPLTYHIVGDNEPRVMADGRIAFIRCDNFLERAKVETHIHVIRPDGQGGEVLLGPNRGPICYDRSAAAEEQSLWLRNFGFGSPAPLPDGRVACLSYMGPIISPQVTGKIQKKPSPSAEEGKERKPTADSRQPIAASPKPMTDGRKPMAAYDKVPLPGQLALFDISPLPDGRLLCSTTRGELGIIDITTGRTVVMYQTEMRDLHAVAYLGPRPKPPVLPADVNPIYEAKEEKSGYLLCQNIFASRQTEADWRRVKAIRVFLGEPLTTRSARHPYDHIGVESIELGTVPVAPDGSFFVRVPADQALAMQAVDAEGRPVVSEMSWIYARPGENRACIGCHNHRQASSAAIIDTLAARKPPIDLMVRGQPHRYRGNNAANGGVLNLQLDRFREVASLDLYPQPALMAGEDGRILPPGRPHEVARLAKLLAGGSTSDKMSAAQRLAIFRARAAVPALVKALADDEADVRANAALALASCGNRTAAPALLKTLLDGTAHAAQAAHVALEHLTGHAEEFTAYLDRTTQTAGHKRWQAWLAQNDWDSIEKNLLARLQAPDPIARQLAIEALGHVGGDLARVALRHLVATGSTDSLPARLAAMRALGHLQDESAVPILGQILEANIKVMPLVAKKSHEFGWVQQPVQLAGAAAEALGWIGTPQAEERLIAAFARLAHFWYYTYRTGDHEWLMGCHSSIPHFRIAEALDAMGSQKAASLTGALLRSIPIDTDRGLFYENDAYETVVGRVIHRAGMARDVVETCLAVLGDTNAKPNKELLPAITATPPAVSVGGLSPPARASQILAVVCLSADDAPRLQAAFQRQRQGKADSRRGWSLFFLARALGQLRDRQATAGLIEALDRDPTEASFGLPDPPNVFLHKAPTPLYRAAVADALGRIGAAEAVPVLLKTVANFDNSMEVRQAAARALGQCAPASALPQLQKLAADYPEVATQRTLQQAYARVRSRTP